jgi:hypothetical protein
MTAPPPADKPNFAPQESLARRALDNPWLMLLMLFGVTLFLGLPFLWMSRGFSTAGKIVVTILVLLWTVIVLACFAAILWWCWQRIAGAL